MSDRPKSTRVTFDLPPELAPPDRDPPPFSLDVALRETYRHLLRQEEGDKLEGLADSVLELTREADVIVRQLDFSFPFNIAAAARDLRYLESWLRVTGAAEGDCLDRWQARLADAATRAAPAVGIIAAELEAAVAANPKE
jgi:hypothetical protein